MDLRQIKLKSFLDQEQKRVKLLNLESMGTRASRNGSASMG